MFYAHTERYSFPNTPEGRSYAEFMEFAFRDTGREPTAKTTSTSIVVEYTELCKTQSGNVQTNKEKTE